MLSRTTAVLSAVLVRRGQRGSKVRLDGHRVSLGEPGRKGKPTKCTTRDNTAVVLYLLPFLLAVGSSHGHRLARPRRARARPAPPRVHNYA